MSGRVRKAVLPVAGLGTRVLPGAKTTPKNMLNVVDRPILSYIVEEARAAGVEHIVFIVGRGQGAIEDYFDSSPEIEGALEAKGKAEIGAYIRGYLAANGRFQLISLDQFMEAENAILWEATVDTALGAAQIYDVVILDDDGLIKREFPGLHGYWGRT